MMTAGTSLVVLLLLLAGPAPEGAAEEPPERPCAEQVALRVQAHYEAVRDLSADFVQSSRVASLGEPALGGMRATGKVTFAKPGRMRWAYESPGQSLVVTDGETLWTYDADLGEAQRVRVGQGFLSGAAIQFLLGEGQILEDFSVESDACDAERVTLRLLPLDPASYERLVVEVDPQNGRVHATEVFDLFGNVTRVELSGIRTNTEPGADLFTFEPPEGTQVIEVPTQP